MFGWLRRLFGRKKEIESTELVEMKEEIKEPVIEEPKERLAPHSMQEPERPEKMCPHCGSPNDKFVHKCWMCKAEI